MKITVENNEIIGRRGINEMLKDISKVMTEHVLASDNKVHMKVPNGPLDTDGIFACTITVEFDEKPHKDFT